MSEEVLGAIKFQHQNLLHLVDHLREKIGPLTNVLKQARTELEKRKNEKTFASPPQKPPLPQFSLSQRISLPQLYF
jgi:hypothetical protein